MKFLNYVRSNFKRVLATDAEYVLDSTGTIPEKVVCFVYTDIFTGEQFPFWENDSEHPERHFNYDEVLIVSYNAVAEVGAYLKLLHGKPKNIWDCYVENARLYKPMRMGKGALKILTTAEHYGIEDKISQIEKDDNINLIIRQGKYKHLPFIYSDKERKQILKYCTSDTEILRKIFIKQVEDIEEKNHLKTEEDFERELWQVQNRGYAMACVAQVEKNGIPVDVPLINKFNHYWPLVKNNLIRRYNKGLDVFTDDLKFNHIKFNELIKKNKLYNWPRLKTGNYTTNKKVVKNFLHIPDIAKLNEIRTFLNMTKLTNYEPGHDRKARTSLFMFGTVTGRASPSTAKYVFNSSKWARNFIKPSYGNKLVYIDYASQEPAIQGYLSKDQSKIEAYQSGDPYIHTAKLFGYLEPGAVRNDETEDIRNIFKVLELANTYGQGPIAVAEQLHCSITKAKKLQLKYRETFKTYFRWLDGVIEEGLHSKRLQTNRGWQRWIKNLYVMRDGKPRDIRNSLMNWPIQSHGAEILREAVMDLTDAFFEVNALVHDALLISIPIPDFKERLVEAKKIMVDAAIKVVKGPIRVEHEEISGNYIQKPKDQILFDEIMNEIEIYRHTPDLKPTYTQIDSTALYN